MNVTLKLYAMLGDYLPEGSKDQQAQFEVTEGTTPTALIRQAGVPEEQCHLVLVNGVYVEPSARDSQALNDGDALAIWPPVAGGAIWPPVAGG